jgi:hypothetical protein
MIVRVVLIARVDRGFKVVRASRLVRIIRVNVNHQKPPANHQRYSR